MVSETLELIIRTSGASQGRQAIQSIESSAKQAATGVNSLNQSFRIMRNTLVAFSFLRIFEGVGAGLSKMQEINNLMTTITRNGREQSLMFQKLGDAANAVRAPIADFTKLFTNLMRSTAGFKLSTDAGIKATQSIFAGFAISGLDEKSIANVSRDMKEVFNLGVVQGRIFRSVVMQDQEEALVLSKYIVATGKNAVAVNKELDRMRSKGQQPDIQGMIVNGEARGAFRGGDIVTANIKAYSEEMARLEKTTVTMGQAVTIVYNKWLMFLSYLNSNTGIFSTMSQWIVKISDYLPEIALFATLVAGLLVVNLVAEAFTHFGSVVSGVFGFILTPARLALNMMVSLGGAVSGFGASIIKVAGGAVNGLMKGIFSLAKVLTGSFSEAATLMTSLGKTALSVGTSLLNVGVGIAGALVVALPIATLAVAAWMTIKQAISDLTPTFDVLISKAKSLGLTAKDIPLMVETGFSDLFSHWSDYREVFSDLWIYVADTFKSKMIDAFNWVIQHGIPTLAEGVTQAIYNAGVGLGKSARSAMGLDPNSSLLGYWTNDTSANKKEAAAALARSETGISTIGNRIIAETAAQKAAEAAASAHGGAGAPGDALDKTKNMRNNVEQMRIEIENMIGSGGGKWDAFLKHWDDLAEKIKKATSPTTDSKGGYVKPLLSQDDVNREFHKMGFLNAEDWKSAEAAKSLGIKDPHKDYLDAKKLADAAMVAQPWLANNIQDTLKPLKYADELRDGATAADGAHVAFEKYNDSLEKTAELGESVVSKALAQRNAVNELSVGYDALTVAVKNQWITQDEMNKSLVELQQNVLKTKTDIGSGFVDGMLEAQKSMNDLAKVASETVTNAFAKLNDTLTDLLVNGKINLRSFTEDILKSFAKLAIQANITGPLANLLAPKPGQKDASGGLFGTLGKITGLTGSTSALGPLGSSVNNAVWVRMASDPNDIFGGKSASGGGGISSPTGGSDNVFNGQVSSQNPLGLIQTALPDLGGGANNPASMGGNAISRAFGDSSGGGNLTGIWSMFNDGNVAGSGGFLSNLFGGGAGGGPGSASGDILGMLQSSGISDAASYVGSGISDAASAVGSGVSAAASYVGSGVADAASAAGTYLAELLPEVIAMFTNGGEFTVGGHGGTDSQLVAFHASPDETVTVRTPAQQRDAARGNTENSMGGMHLHLHGVSDFDSFQRNRSQVTAGFTHMAAKVARRNGTSRS